MYNTNLQGVLEVDTAKAVGGHAVCAVDALTLKLPGTAKRQQYIVVQNSWGVNWGVPFKKQGGFCFLTLDAMGTLLEQGGEGAVPLKG